MVIVSKEWIKYDDDQKSMVDPNNVLMMASSAAAPPPPNAPGNNFQVIKSKLKDERDKEANECARIVLLCQPNSHPFQTRNILLEPNIEYKVGRSIARSKVCENNAIFDCKVLSRNHAVLWYGDGKFYVKDTKSSNGTFINDRKIPQSEAEELSSGDVVKFGVDVVENSRKEVHGCIIACVKLYMPDGRESISINSSNRASSVSGDGNISFDEMHRLHHYIQEMMQRERLLEKKLHDIQNVLDVTRKNTSACWQSMIDEDRLISRIDILENKLQFMQKNSPENQLKDEILRLQDEKLAYQNSAKEALRKAYQERLDAMQKLSTIERGLFSSEDECSMLRVQLSYTQQNLLRLETEFKEYKEQSEKSLNEAKEQECDGVHLKSQLREREQECEEYKNRIKAFLNENSENSAENSDNGENTENFETESASDKTENGDETSEQIEKSTKEEDDEDNSSQATKSTIMKWLENSDINQSEESKNIMKAFCNASDSSDEEDTQANSEPLDGDLNVSCAKIDAKLQVIGKKLAEIEAKLLPLPVAVSPLSVPVEENSNSASEDETNSIPVETTSDGNQNVDSDAKPEKTETVAESLLKTDDISSIREAFNEISESWKRQQTLTQKEYDIHSKIVSDSEQEIKKLKAQLDAQASLLVFHDQTTNDEIKAFKLKIDDLQQEILLLKDEKHSLEKVIESNEVNRKSLEISKHLPEESSSAPHVDEIITNSEKIPSPLPPPSSASSFDLVIKEDLATMNDKAIQQEEELVLFKEKYENMLNENLKLKSEIQELQSKINDIFSSNLRKLFTYGAVIIAVIIYFILSYF